MNSGKDPDFDEDRALFEALTRKRIGKRYEIYWTREGGMGTVYLCLAQPRPGYMEMPFPVALKTLRKEFLADDSLVNQFKTEADVWINLEKHDNIAQAYAVEQIEDIYYILIEWVMGDPRYGPSLRDWIKGGGLDVAQSVVFAIQFCRGMQYAEHRFELLHRHFVHRDIKPENILIRENHTLKITDFGLVNVAAGIQGDFGLDTADTGTPAEMTGVTKQGAVIGTPEYMAPEQFCGDPSIDRRSDVYSFGCVLYEMICGVRPFVPPQSYVVTDRNAYYSVKHRHQDPTEPRSLNPTCPGELNRIVLKCLAKNPEARYQDFSEIQRELEGLGRASLNNPTTDSNQMTEDEWQAKGDSLMTLEKPVSAIECYDRVIERNGRNESAWLNKGRALGWIGHYQEALGCFETAEKVRRVVTRRKIGMMAGLKGSCMDGLGRHPEALALYDQALNVDGANPDLWYAKGLTCSKHGSYADALACFNKCLEIAPRFVRAWSDKAIALSKTDQLNEAILCCDQAIEISARYLPAWVTKGNVLSKLERFSDAIQCYDRALAIDPDDAIARENRDGTIELMRRRDSPNPAEMEQTANYEAKVYKIRFNNSDYVLSQLGELTTVELAERFEFPYAHVFANGEIKRLGKTIGTVSDIELIGTGVMRVDPANRKVVFTWQSRVGPR